MRFDSNVANMFAHCNVFLLLTRYCIACVCQNVANILLHGLFSPTCCQHVVELFVFVKLLLDVAKLVLNSFGRGWNK